MMADLSAAVFGLDLNGDVNTMRQNLQQEYVDRLIGLFEGAGVDHVAAAALLREMKRVQSQLQSAAAASAATDAHRELVLHKIERALEP